MANLIGRGRRDRRDRRDRPVEATLEDQEQLEPKLVSTILLSFGRCPSGILKGMNEIRDGTLQI